MFTDTESEILSSTWALSEQHAQPWLLMVAQILQGKQVSQADPNFKKEVRGYIIDQDGQPIDRNENPNTPINSIGVIEISGPMVKKGSWYRWGAEELVRIAEYFERDPNIIGHIWLLDSGGGSVNAIAPFREFQKKKTKPLIGLADMCASANLYAGVGCDKLVARNNISSMFGSIGVMATLIDYTEYLKAMGIKERLIYASQSSFKHKSYNEALKGKDGAFKKEHLNPLAIQFQEFVKSQRPKLKTDVEGILEGKMFYAEEAQEIGLIDGIMDFEEAVEEVKFLSQVRTYMNN
ncbi:peptidase S49-like protein [Gramella sp. Hel_I_59]|uniref:S49 family peptidase n=1 Tax=Gramella sp. Hel_I_59 TaxID=1249978 RepID=UPI00115362CF|nr:S49 family peptidase [Gramella sp. Hel_I_59]TQI72273.1 peptidase S49-like protein [Gramella sp. Hel_I_59]